MAAKEGSQQPEKTVQCSTTQAHQIKTFYFGPLIARVIKSNFFLNVIFITYVSNSVSMLFFYINSKKAFSDYQK